MVSFTAKSTAECPCRIDPWLQPASGRSDPELMAVPDTKLTGADGSRVRITAQNVSTVQIELDADGNGVYELATTRAWSSLL